MISFEKKEYEPKDELSLLTLLEDLIEINEGGYIDRSDAQRLRMYVNGRIIELRKKLKGRLY